MCKLSCRAQRIYVGLLKVLFEGAQLVTTAKLLSFVPGWSFDWIYLRTGMWFFREFADFRCPGVKFDRFCESCKFVEKVWRGGLGRQNRVTALQSHRMIALLSMNQSYFPLQSRGVPNDQEQWRGDLVFWEPVTSAF